MFVHRLSPLFPWPDFRAPLARTAALGLVLIAVSLGVGMLGYHHIAGQALDDSFLNAAMILSGMGPIGSLREPRPSWLRPPFDGGERDTLCVPDLDFPFDERLAPAAAPCEAVQKGLQSRSYDRGRYSVRRENGVHHFQSLLTRALRGD